jgi:hypothetical protein
MVARSATSASPPRSWWFTGRLTAPGAPVPTTLSAASAARNHGRVANVRRAACRLIST